MRTAFDAAARQAGRRARGAGQVAWPYTSLRPAGKVAERKEVTDLDTVFVRFENGVRLTVKPTKFRDDEVLVRVRFGDGPARPAHDRQTLAWAGSAFIEGGLKQISAEDTERVLASQVYGAGFGVGRTPSCSTGHPHQRPAPPRCRC